MSEDNIYSPPAAPLDQAAVGNGAAALASRWARLGAAIADGLIMLGVTLAVFPGSDNWQKAMTQDLALMDMLLPLAFSLGLYLLLNGYLLQRRGQTIGKWMLGIRIVAVDSNAILPLWRVFLFRYLPQVLASLIPLAGGLLILADLLFIFRGDKRCVHDLIAGTHVVREPAREDGA